ncbi:hypothetical protein Anapl_13674 [Anas platyrhynchos]|uniref:Uncharacterized protein n=1 Tax=Anas platyrhynchos TaxID=8839 RepID=R0KZH0_ANAPL|nr:hypothetical protein Anapl_13674 [Anas platyrhynchos]
MCPEQADGTNNTTPLAMQGTACCLRSSLPPVCVLKTKVCGCCTRGATHRATRSGSAGLKAKYAPMRKRGPWGCLGGSRVTETCAAVTVLSSVWKRFQGNRGFTEDRNCSEPYPRGLFLGFCCKNCHLTSHEKHVKQGQSWFRQRNITDDPKNVPWDLQQHLCVSGSVTPRTTAKLRSFGNLQVPESQRFLGSRLSVSSELLWYCWFEASSDPPKFSVRSLARSQGLMQTFCTLALLFGLPLSALAAKGHPNPTPGLPIAALLSLIQSFKKTPSGSSSLSFPNKQNKWEQTQTGGLRKKGQEEGVFPGEVSVLTAQPLVGYSLRWSPQRELGFWRTASAGTSEQPGFVTLAGTQDRLLHASPKASCGRDKQLVDNPLAGVLSRSRAKGRWVACACSTELRLRGDEEGAQRSLALPFQFTVLAAFPTGGVGLLKCFLAQGWDKMCPAFSSLSLGSPAVAFKCLCSGAGAVGQNNAPASQHGPGAQDQAVAQPRSKSRSRDVLPYSPQDPLVVQLVGRSLLRYQRL